MTAIDSLFKVIKTKFPKTPALEWYDRNEYNKKRKSKLLFGDILKDRAKDAGTTA